MLEYFPVYRVLAHKKRFSAEKQDDLTLNLKSYLTFSLTKMPFLLLSKKQQS
jgi:hypothetical protein